VCGWVYGVVVVRGFGVCGCVWVWVWLVCVCVCVTGFGFVYIMLCTNYIQVTGNPLSLMYFLYKEI